MICQAASSEDLYKVSFNCGQDGIDSYFEEKLLTDHDAVSYCFWTDASKQELVGIASLSCSGIIIQSRNHFNITPAIEVKIFAIDEKYQHQAFPDDDGGALNWSDYCLYYLLEKITDIAENICGASHVVLYSVPEAVSFYRRNFLSTEWKSLPICSLTAAFPCSSICNLLKKWSAAHLIWQGCR